MKGNNMQRERSSVNNGGTTDYYQFDPQWKQVQDIIEARGMNFSQGNILKAAFCFNTYRHGGTNYERELNKIIWFCKRELQRLYPQKYEELPGFMKSIIDSDIPGYEDQSVGC